MAAVVEVQLLQVEVQQPLSHLLQLQPPVVLVSPVVVVAVLQLPQVVVVVVQQPLFHLLEVELQPPVVLVSLGVVLQPPQAVEAEAGCP